MRRLRLLLSIALLVGLVLPAVPAGALPPPDVDGAACVVTGAIAYGPPPLGVLPAAIPFAAVLTFNCVSPLDENGVWVIPIAGLSTIASCAFESGGGAVGVSAFSGGDPGGVIGGTATWARYGLIMDFALVVLTPGETHHAAARTVWQPGPGICPTATAAVTGTGVITDL
jgi:hypothetical protein